ncbi:MAG: hypothetical protein KPEEDBHJ_03122 [Anaerolineales bacterium]|nr:hypothetical protein [Anaerolineales bacterium]
MEKPSFLRNKLVIGGIVVIALISFGWYLASLDGRIAIVTSGAVMPTNTEVSMTATITPIAPTEATVAPSTLSPQAEQARAFAEPILQAIADRPPDFEDDFSTINPNWQIDTYDGPCGKIAEGIITTSIVPEQMTPLSYGRYTCGVHNSNDLTVTNFVFDVDLIQTSSEIQGIAGVQWRHISNSNRYDSYYRVAVEIPGNRWTLARSFSNSPAEGVNEILQEWQGPSSGRIRVIGWGDQFAIYINETPVFYLKDDLNPSGEIDLILNAADGPVTVEYDNLKIWNLDMVPGLPTATTRASQTDPARAFAEPILQAIANRTPEVKDDFSFDNGNWSTGVIGQNSAQIADGMLQLTVNDAVGDTWMGSRHEAMSADDFVVQFDVRIPAMEFDSHLSILWRWLPSDNASYQLAFFPSLSGAWSVGGTGGDFFFQGANGNSDSVRFGEWFTVIIIGRDDRFAVMLNDQPLYYFEDSQRPLGRVVLGMNIFSGDAIAEFDNVKYWDLANVPSLP